MYARGLMELILVFVIAWQLVIPLIEGTPVFPLFRRRRRAKLLTQIEHAKEDLVEDTLDQQLARLKARHAELTQKEKEARTEIDRQEAEIAAAAQDAEIAAAQKDAVLSTGEEPKP